MKLMISCVALAAAMTLIGCSTDSTSPARTDGPSASASTPGDGGTTASSDTLGGDPRGEWHLKTIRGLVLGLDRASTGDTSAANTTPIANAKIEIHKISLAIAPAAGADSATGKVQDLGVVASVTTDASGRFDYVIDEPLVVKTGQPSPLITYRLTISPPTGSAYSGQSGVQVFFAEQLQGDGVFRYYLFHPKA